LPAAGRESLVVQISEGGWYPNAAETDLTSAVAGADGGPRPPKAMTGNCAVVQPRPDTAGQHVDGYLWPQDVAARRMNGAIRRRNALNPRMMGGRI
jgi:hypothetical protein